MKTTITEALAELPTIEKRLTHKREFITAYMWRQSLVRDPHEKDGGSAELIKREFQSMYDLQARIVAIRTAIQQANHVNTITIGTDERTIAEWLTWRREVAPSHLTYLKQLFNHLTSLRRKASQEGVNVKDADGEFSRDYIVNLNEKELTMSIEAYETTLGALDGKLSLANATITIELP